MLNGSNDAANDKATSRPVNMKHVFVLQPSMVAADSGRVAFVSTATEYQTKSLHEGQIMGTSKKAGTHILTLIDEWFIDCATTRP